MTMSQSALVLITGLPGAGKSTLAARLSEALLLPVISRDALKELLADSFGEPDEEQVRAITGAQFKLFYKLLDQLLQAGVSLIADSNLHRDIAPDELRPLLVHARAVLVHCDTPRAVSNHRYAERFAGGERHPIHRDASFIAQFEERLTLWEPYEEPLALGVPILRVDTTAGYRPGLTEIVAFVQSELGEPSTVSPYDMYRPH
jgi:predicted kinase